MDAIIRFKNGLEARLNHDGWKCADEDMRLGLELLYGLDQIIDYDPNPIANQADKAAQEFGAELIQAPETEWQEGVVY